MTRNVALLFVSSALYLVACDQPVASPDNNLPAADTDAAMYLYDLSEDEINSIADQYALDPEEMKDQLLAPFECSEFGDLCTAVGPEAAEEVIGQVVEQARASVDLEEIRGQALSSIDLASQDWEAPQVWTSDYAVWSFTAHTNCKLYAKANIYSIVVSIEHVATAQTKCETSSGSYAIYPLDVEVEGYSKRTKGTTVTTKSCSDHDDDGDVSCTNSLKTNGTHTLEACAFATDYSSSWLCKTITY